MRNLLLLLLFSFLSAPAFAERCEQLLLQDSVTIDQVARARQWRIEILKNQVTRSRIKRQSIVQSLSRYYGSRVHLGQNYYKQNFPSDIELQRKVKSLKKMGTDYELLLFHPYVYFNTNDFINFLKKYQGDLPADPWQALEAFSESLGTVTVYRGMALSPKTFEQILEKGMRVPITETLQPSLGQHINEHFGRDQAKKSEDNGIASVTFIPKVAARVARTYLKKNLRQTYVYELKIPKLEIIPGQPDGDFNLNAKVYLMKNLDLLLIYKNQRKKRYSYSSDLESYLQNGFRTEEIVEIHHGDDLDGDLFWMNWAPKI